MPIYEFECPIHGVFERILSLEFSDAKHIVCMHEDSKEGFCLRNAEKVWSASVVSFGAKPTIVFKNPKTGEMEVATHENQQAPYGYVKEELRGPIERTKFEKEASQRRYVEDELTTEKLKQGRDKTRKNLHDDLNARMNTFDSNTQNMIKMSMRHARKRHERIKPKRTNIMLEVNHKDSSNLIK